MLSAGKCTIITNTKEVEVLENVLDPLHYSQYYTQARSAVVLNVVITYFQDIWKHGIVTRNSEHELQPKNPTQTLKD